MRDRYKAERIATVWHPSPRSDLLPMQDGVNLRVLVGELAYQLSDGTMRQF